MALVFSAVESITERPEFYADFSRISSISLDKRGTKAYLRAYVRLIDRSPIARQAYGAPENLYIHEGPGADPGYFAPFAPLPKGALSSRY